MKNSELISAFVAGTARDGQHANSVSVKDNKLYSYATCIAERADNGIVVNETKYSKTTSKHQGYLYGAIRKYDVWTILVDGVARGTTHLAYAIYA